MEKRVPPKSFPPHWFHKFRHRTKVFASSSHHASWTTPLWVVGVSPFDTVVSPEEGYVVHLGEPRFVARWILGSQPSEKAFGKIDFHDEDLDISIYEVSLLDKDESNIQDWLLESACAVAYSRGIIGELEPPEPN